MGKDGVICLNHSSMLSDCSASCVAVTSLMGGGGESRELGGRRATSTVQYIRVFKRSLNIYKLTRALSVSRPLGLTVSDRRSDWSHSASVLRRDQPLQHSQSPDPLDLLYLL